MPWLESLNYGISSRLFRIAKTTMFRHSGETRTLQHNLKIASLLSFVAGMVNVAGFFSVQRLTTNVTGHFAFFVDEVLQINFLQGFIFFLYILSFFFGSFLSSFLVEWIYRKKGYYIYVIPVVIESVILLFVAIFGNFLVSEWPDLLACLLLFAMGLQNSLVTSISSSAVRTTHLTGLFTDLGIELSQLFFYKQQEHQNRLHSAIKLRLTIICFFFVGGITGGLIYSSVHLKVLILAATILLLGILYDYLKLRVIMIRRRYKTPRTEITGST